MNQNQCITNLFSRTEVKIFLYYTGIFLLSELMVFFIHKNNLSFKAFAEKHSLSNVIYLIVSVFISTLIIIALIKKKKKSLKLLDLIITYSGSSSFFLILGYKQYSILLALLLTIIKYFSESNFYRNFLVLIITATFSSIISDAIANIPLLIFAILMSIYDYIAVFKTKHMVFIAKAMKSKKYLFTSYFKGKRPVEIGTGDFAIPLMVILSYDLKIAIFLFLLSNIALIISIKMLNKKRKFMPALPLQIIFIVAFLIIAKFALNII